MLARANPLVGADALGALFGLDPRHAPRRGAGLNTITRPVTARTIRARAAVLPGAALLFLHVHEVMALALRCGLDLSAHCDRLRVSCARVGPG